MCPMRERDRAEVTRAPTRSQNSKSKLDRLIHGEEGMADFTSRGMAFESKFAHDEALRFKAMSRRNRLLGLWAARQLGKSGAEAATYAGTVVMADFEEAGDEDVIRKVVGDLDGAGVPADEGQVRRVLEGFMDRATEEIKAGT
jgi:hypothetical protein